MCWRVPGGPATHSVILASSQKCCQNLISLLPLSQLVLGQGHGVKGQRGREEGDLVDSSPEVSASLPLASAAAAASSWAMEVSLPTSLWGHELMTMTLWSGELPEAVPWAPKCPGPNRGP